ncbi:MAG: hypothetical protein ABUT39_28050 [Acidobacteriota bacterium]
MKRSRDWCDLLRPYNTARGMADAAILDPPPFTFPGVTARFFPLRASPNILSSFYRSYLDVAPEICLFKPTLPWVLLVVLDYGYMASEETNLGWVSQHEIFFGVPLEEWRSDRPGGPPVFRRWVLNTPFIFVDDASSITVGREVYGWPKVQAKLRKTRGKWLADPCAATRLLSLNVKGFGDRRCDAIRLLDIDQRSNQNVSLVPLDLKAVDPFKRLSRWIELSWSAGLELAELVARAPLSGFGPEDPEADCEVLFDTLRQVFNFYQDPEMEVVTLKQFPDAHNPAQICYESLVLSRMGISRFNRGGLLGLPNVLQGEADGGFRIRLHQDSAFPIVESLGLQVARERTIDGHSVSVLEPIFPFWMSVDLRYGKGESLCWRMKGTPWYRERTPVGGPTRSAPYNTFAGAGQQVWCGPFYIPKACWDVFPLRADAAKLRRFIERYLNLGEPYRFEPWGSYVYMIASTSRMFSLVKSAAWLDSNQINFVVPLLCYEGRQLKGILVTRPFSFCDNPTMTMTLQEVQGVPALAATIKAMPRFWRNKEPMLKMRLKVFTALDEGLEGKNRTLLEVVRRAPSPGCSLPPPCDPCIQDIARLIDWNELPLHTLTLKQFRDAAYPTLACYQALVLEPWTLSKPRQFKPLKPGTAVKIFRYPSIPLAETLGLEHDFVVPPKVEKGAIADVFCPDSPFRVEWTVHIGLAEAISRTAGFLPWQSYREAARDIPDFRQMAEEDAQKLIASGPQEIIRALVAQAGGPAPETSPDPVQERGARASSKRGKRRGGRRP